MFQLQGFLLFCQSILVPALNGQGQRVTAAFLHRRSISHQVQMATPFGVFHTYQFSVYYPLEISRPFFGPASDCRRETVFLSPHRPYQRFYLIQTDFTTSLCIFRPRKRRRSKTLKRTTLEVITDMLIFSLCYPCGALMLMYFPSAQGWPAGQPSGPDKLSSRSREPFFPVRQPVQGRNLRPGLIYQQPPYAYSPSPITI